MDTRTTLAWWLVGSFVVSIAASYVGAKIWRRELCGCRR